MSDEKQSPPSESGWASRGAAEVANVGKSWGPPTQADQWQIKPEAFAAARLAQKETMDRASVQLYDQRKPQKRLKKLLSNFASKLNPDARREDGTRTNRLQKRARTESEKGLGSRLASGFGAIKSVVQQREPREPTLSQHGKSNVRTKDRGL